MHTLWRYIESRDGEPVLKESGQPIAEVVARLEQGGIAEVLRGPFVLQPVEVVAALGFDALGDDSPENGPALVQTRPRRPALELACGEKAIAELFPQASRPARLGLAAGLLQIHDFWDASHKAAQEADDLGESLVSPYWHGIAHRREPDAGNATYWFRRVGRHKLFGPLAASSRPLIERADPSLLSRLLPGGNWDPFAFIAFCDSGRSSSAELALALQRLEMTILLEASIPS